MWVKHAAVTFIVRWYRPDSSSRKHLYFIELQKKCSGSCKENTHCLWSGVKDVELAAAWFSLVKFVLFNGFNRFLCSFWFVILLMPGIVCLTCFEERENFFPSVSLKNVVPIWAFPPYISSWQDLGSQSPVQAEYLHTELKCGKYRNIIDVRHWAISTEEAKLK